MVERRAGYYSLTKDKFSKYRLEAMLNAFRNGITDQDGLAEVQRIKQNHLTNREGAKSEISFDKFIQNVPIVKSVKNASISNDVYSGIDKLVEFKPETHLPILPVQIKSSEDRVNKYKKSKKFKNLSGLVIVLNCGPKRLKEKSYIRKQFNSELQRIRTILSEQSKKDS